MFDWIDGVVAAGSGVAGSVGTLVMQKKSAKRDDFTALVDNWKGIYEEVVKREQKCEERINILTSKIEVLQSEIIDLRSKI